MEWERVSVSSTEEIEQTNGKDQVICSATNKIHPFGTVDVKQSDFLRLEVMALRTLYIK